MTYTSDSLSIDRDHHLRVPNGIPLLLCTVTILPASAESRTALTHRRPTTVLPPLRPPNRVPTVGEV